MDLNEVKDLQEDIERVLRRAERILKDASWCKAHGSAESEFAAETDAQEELPFHGPQTHEELVEAIDDPKDTANGDIATALINHRLLYRDQDAPRTLEILVIPRKDGTTQWTAVIRDAETGQAIYEARDIPCP